MEEPKPPSVQNNPQANPKKRPFDNNANIQNSNYFKIRAVLKDLRPHFLEVLRTPDFQTSKAACEIGQQMKLLMNLYKEITSENDTIEKCKNEADGGHPLSGELHDDKKPTDVKPAETQQQPPLEKERVFTRKPSEERPAVLNNSEKHLFEDGKLHGSYIVGGSAFGWNFITYPSTQLATYYGRTKKAFRAANPVSKPAES